MVAYSFKRQFVAAIRSGTKRQTIRADRKRHARPGEAVQLFTGMRTRNCVRLLHPDPVCESVTPIRIFVTAGWIELPGAKLGILAGIDDFARDDGFEDWMDMRRFWRSEHPTADIFEGVLVRWRL
jgi:hypothetical protein